MTADSTNRERRIRQFEHYLALMAHRTLDVVKSDSFLMFSVPAPPVVRPRIGGSDTRIVQFAFTEGDFYIDLPDTTLTIDEAKVVASRAGFEFALKKQRKTLGERECDPVQRRYQYDEQRSAAEDAAYLFFDLWQTPLDAWIKITAATFETGHRWEHEFTMS